MIITCPHCQTRYQVTAETIGSAGRKVMCAHCHEAWQASPEPEPPARPALAVVPVTPTPEEDLMFSDGEEEALDTQFEEVAEAVAPARPVQPRDDAADRLEMARLDAALSRRRAPKANGRRPDFFRQLPYARIRNIMRTVALSLLIALIAGSIIFRTDIVRAAPSLSGLYASLGMPVNVVGLDFSRVESSRTTVDGVAVLEVSGSIRSVSSGIVQVPHVVVTLLSETGGEIYSWSVAPTSPDLEAGETLAFSTHLTGPPDGAESVRLTFAGQRPTETTIAPAGDH